MMYRSKKLVIGIQGGKGSFNEQAVNEYISKYVPKEIYHEIVYLYTTANVFNALKENTIDLGQFAMHNSVGGIVHESLYAIADNTFEIVEEFEIKISHHMMVHKDIEPIKVRTYMTHPQVIKQCKRNIKRFCSSLNITTGEGDLIDHAKVAEAISIGEINSSIGVIGPAVLADIYDLRIIRSDLQDSDENYTSFLMVRNKVIT
jgi:prephenate dehydratase